MNNNRTRPTETRSERRTFFGQLFAIVAGGFMAGGILRSLLKSQKDGTQRGASVRISANPLAVPRTKEGSKSNV